MDTFSFAGPALAIRRAYLMELDPPYCDVIVTRWQQFTGQRAVLEGDGQCFDEVAEERRAEASKAETAPQRSAPDTAQPGS